jgi:hypothetical protein
MVKKKFFFATCATCAVIVVAAVYLNSLAVDLPAELHGTWCYRDFDYQPKTRELVRSPTSSSLPHSEPVRYPRENHL